MPVLRQTYLKGAGVPTSLKWQLYSSSEEFSSALSSTAPGDPPSRFTGLSIHTTEKGVLEFVAVTIDDRAFVIKASVARNETLKKLFDGDMGRVVGFGIVRLAMHIKAGLDYDVRGYDLPSKDKDSKNISPGSAVYNLLDPSADSFAIDYLWDFHPDEVKDNVKKLEFLCLRAWIQARLASHQEWSSLISVSKAAETSRLSRPGFKCLFRMIKELDMMDAAKPRTVHNDFSSVKHTKDGRVIVQNERYKSRVRNSEKTKVVFVDSSGNVHTGKTKGVEGKKTFVQRTGKTHSAIVIKQIQVHGREELTNAEKARDEFLLRLLQGEAKLLDDSYLFVGRLWFPATRKTNLKRISNAKIREGQNGRLINQSQANVVQAMIHSNRPVVVVHGPPGTGKTTTISVAMRELSSLRRRTWIVAQSNVGVKNIAESLCKHDVDFKLLVSKEFYFEWHEHIYAEVSDHLIRTDELPDKQVDIDMLFTETLTMLCTISTLSNPTLTENNLFKLIPLETLVVDEASQIGVLDYLHIFGRFKELKKVCFFGDPKQLPPYGQDAAPSLQSIYDIPHLKSTAYFLDTQYRMPTNLGDFISRAVYSSKLKSAHAITGWNCIKFVDVWNGNEEKAGKSWKNMREVQTIVHLVRYYYRNRDFCIITPYDAQRSAIQTALKREKLPWENVFNVDSFQGNEAQYVLVSVVRTTGPGFLKSQNRVNVMLTRCKVGMVIVTKREFTRYDNARKTLLGKLVLHWEGQVGKASTWCKWNEVAEKKANLPVNVQ